jgi:hypothetical protein
LPNYYGLIGGTVRGVAPGGGQLQPIQVPTDIKPGDSTWLFGIVPAANAGGADDALIKGEQPAINTASIPISITPPVSGGPPPEITFELSFYATGTLIPAAPGTFELDIQEADTDADAFYILPTAAAYKVTAVVAATQKARVDLQPTGGKFMRVLLLARANGVDLVAKVSRIA